MADFSKDALLIQPRSLRAADIVRQKPNGFVEPLEPKAFDGLGEISGVGYVLTAWNASAEVEATFRHEIEHQLILNQGAIGRRPGVNLFQPASLNHVLRTDKFPGVKSLEFIC